MSCIQASNLHFIKNEKDSFNLMIFYQALEGKIMGIIECLCM